MPKPYVVRDASGRRLAAFGEAGPFYPVGVPLLREDEVLFAAAPKSGAQLASWLGATFGMVRAGGAKPHQGWDFFAAPGTPCFAVAGGVVARTSTMPQDLGNLIVIKPHAPLPGAGRALLVYAHLSEIAVKPGQHVGAGEPIGRTGLSGNLADHPRYPHLHFELRLTDPAGTGLGNRLDPARLFGNPQRYRWCNRPLGLVDAAVALALC